MSRRISFRPLIFLVLCLLVLTAVPAQVLAGEP